VVPDENVARVDELPEPWGLMVPKGRTVRIVKKAAKLDPVPVDRKFLAALFIRAEQKNVDKKQLTAAREAGYKDGLEKGKSNGQYTIDSLRRDKEELADTIQKFEQLSGLSINSYNCGNIGHSVKQFIEFRQMLSQPTSEKLELQRIIAFLQGQEALIKKRIHAIDGLEKLKTHPVGQEG
jgi:hypothetical protein